ncbi:hypothetical protein BpHYR1_037193 [Brachionus plicatilis]|uniref:Uncharacterized protein n=1 Tax=Brachionus plicatilis TaxID=10195 RepID=A0A3M7SI91_BRAPC|nr:hypothetical protein BpHYR1_037193 [Brachionus plicatilis]
MNQKCHAFFEQNFHKSNFIYNLKTILYLNGNNFLFSNTRKKNTNIDAIEQTVSWCLFFKCVISKKKDAKT